MLTGAAISWDFGEPSAGPANTAVGMTVQHRYAQPGTYQATMQWLTTSGQVYSYTQPVTILAQLHTQLRASAQACTGQSLTLSISPPPPAGTTYSWQDGSTGATLNVTASGSYWVDIIPLQSCAYRNTLTVQFLPTPVLQLGPDRPIGCEETVLLDATSGIAGSQYHWQDGSTAAQYQATRAGTYTVTVTTPVGCTSAATVHLYARDSCLVSVPNIITPNGDQLNERFVVNGIPPGTCSLSIYNRWGKVVYAQAHYANDWQATGQAAGIYYYLVTTATNQRYKGWVEVIAAAN